MIASLQKGDSLIYYQCHVEELEQQIATAGGQTLHPAPQKYSITEKFVITRDSLVRLRSYVSSMIILPNKRFSGLKIREKEYWNFKKTGERILGDTEIRLLAAIEQKGTEPNEYGFAVSKYNPNQVIIRQRKNFKQLNIAGDYVLSRLMKL